MNELNDLLTAQQFTEVPLSQVLLNLLVCMVFVSLVGWFYKKHSRSLGGKTFVGAVLPLIGLTVFLVITVIKSSLALSLGLVGALSIVRFRTPIKEPEELGYIFLTIAIGLGFGANFGLVTGAVTLLILLYQLIFNSPSRLAKVEGEYTVVLNILDSKYQNVSKLIEDNVIAFKVTRVESIGDRTVVYYNISAEKYLDLQDLISKLKQQDESIDFNLVESGVNW
ncbi:DUF4956 domain-containing protein [Oceanospirillaceae bacterium]|nr:DUF4956 domain-containing protein [Oceanospirillaceae bacterium]